MDITDGFYYKNLVLIYLILCETIAVTYLPATYRADSCWKTCLTTS